MDEESNIFIRNINIGELEQFILKKVNPDNDPTVSIKIGSIERFFRFDIAYDSDGIEDISIRYTILKKHSDNYCSKNLSSLKIYLNRFCPLEFEIKNSFENLEKFFTENEYPKLHTFLKLVDRIVLGHTIFSSSGYYSKETSRKEEAQTIKDLFKIIELIDNKEVDLNIKKNNLDNTQFENYVSDYVNSRNIEEDEDDYCPICQESPCRCSDFDPE